MLASFIKKVADAVRDITKRNFSPRLARGIGGLPIPEACPEELKLKPAPTPERPRRKNIPGAFAKHNLRKGLRPWSQPGRTLRTLVAISTREGLKVASRERVKRMLRTLGAHKNTKLA
jgi:hypothetical protein